MEVSFDAGFVVASVGGDRGVVKGGLLVSQPPISVRIPENELAIVGTMPIKTKAGRKQRPRGTTERVSTARACSSALQRRA
jgi:hypothetical protein